MPACVRVAGCMCVRQAYYILDELVIAGEQQETSKKAVLKLITEQDAVCEEGTDKDMQ
jgi:AP-1 complex subunit sigma 1/2